MVRLDQGLMDAFLTFIETEEVGFFTKTINSHVEYLQKSTKLTINMNSDLKAIRKGFEKLVEKQSNETKMYFDCIHVSPIKVNIVFGPKKLPITIHRVP